MRKPLLMLIAVVLTMQYYHSYGQSTCAQTLRLAQSVYEQGRLQELPQLLESCLHSGFTDQEKVSAYKLLTLTYIYLEEPEKADQSMLALLRTNNEFQVNDAVDPAEFVALYKTFRTAPIYRIGGKFGSIASMPSVISADYVNDGNTKYSNRFGFTGAVAAEIPLAKKFRKFTLNPELSFQLRSFSSVNKDADSVLLTTAIENQMVISLPLSVQYNVYEKAKSGTSEKGKSNAYVSAGFAVDYMLSASKKVDSKRGSDNSPVEQKSFDIKEQRNAINIGIIASAGFKRKIGKGYFVGELRYQMGLTPLLTKADTYENFILVTDYKHVDAIFKLNSISVTLGYLLNRYNPKKLYSK